MATSATVVGDVGVAGVGYVELGPHGFAQNIDRLLPAIVELTSPDCGREPLLQSTQLVPIGEAVWTAVDLVGDRLRIGGGVSERQ